MDAIKNRETTRRSKRETKFEKGYVGHLVQLANVIKESEEPVVVEESDKVEEWREFINGFLAERNVKNNTKIGGDPKGDLPTKRPKSHFKVDDEEMEYGGKKIEIAAQEEMKLVENPVQAEEDRRAVIPTVKVGFVDTTEPEPPKSTKIEMAGFGSLEHLGFEEDNEPKTPSNGKKSASSFEGF